MTDYQLFPASEWLDGELSPGDWERLKALARETLAVDPARAAAARDRMCGAHTREAYVLAAQCQLGFAQAVQYELRRDPDHPGLRGLMLTAQLLLAAFVEAAEKRAGVLEGIR